MINGVLVERTVKDVVPSLKTNSDGLKQVLDELLKQYKTKQGEMDSWKVSAFFSSTVVDVGMKPSKRQKEAESMGKETLGRGIGVARSHEADLTASSHRKRIISKLYSNDHLEIRFQSCFRHSKGVMAIRERGRVK